MIIVEGDAVIQVPHREDLLHRISKLDFLKNESFKQSQIGLSLVIVLAFGTAFLAYGVASNESDTRGVTAVAYSPDGKLLATVNGRINIIQTSDGNVLKTLPVKNVISIAFSNDGHTLAAGIRNSSKNIKLLDVDSGRLINTFDCASSDVSAIAFSTNGFSLATGSSDGTVRLWHLPNGELVNANKICCPVNGITFAPNGKKFATCSGNSNHSGEVRFWNTSNGRLMRSLIGHNRCILSLAFSPDGNMIASGGLDEVVNLWRINDLKLLASMNTVCAVKSIAFSPNGQQLAIGGGKKSEGFIQLWSVPNGNLLRSEIVDSRTIKWVGYSPKGESLVSASEDAPSSTDNTRHPLAIWRVSDWKLVKSYGF